MTITATHDGLCPAAPSPSTGMVSVILCTYNRANRLRQALQSLRKIHLPSDLAWELVVVDNNSRDDTEQVVQHYQRTAPFDVRYVFESKQGHSHARNRGVEEARGDVLAFTDDDVTVDVHWLAEIRQTYERFDCLGIGGRIVPVWTSPRPGWFQENGQYALMKAIVSFDHGDDALVLKTPPFGANMSFRRAAFLRYGLFRTDLGRLGTRLRGADDTEFGNRLLRNNERIIYNPRVVIYHPVDHERATRAYFQRWYFEYGRTSVRVRPRTKVLRSLAASLLRCATARDPQRRFYYRLLVFENLGRIRQMCGFTTGDVPIPRLSGATSRVQCRDRWLGG